MNIGDVIRVDDLASDVLATIPIGAAFLADGHLWQWFGLGAQTPMRSLTGGGWTYPGEALLEYGRFVIVYTPGRLPRPERVVKAEAWAEGFEAGHACTGATLTALCAGRKPNPYRIEAGDAL